MPSAIRPIDRLKRQLERLERPRAAEAGQFALGEAALDARLGGGLARGALHEICAGGEGDHPAASGFALMLAMRASGRAGEGGAGQGGAKPVLWVREDKGARMDGQLYAPGLAELGFDPGRLILVQAPDTLAALRAGADILGSLGLGAVVIEPFGEARALDLTASRRLVLAAERAGVAAFVLRARTSGFASAASTRWHVASASSHALPGDAPGVTALSLALVRHRGGIAPFEILLEWDRDETAFREPALLRDHLPAPQRGQMAA